jgi:hypothetical protein
MKTPALFNGPVEIGMRAAMVLANAFPERLDLNRLVILDYIVVHSGDFPDGPPSLHPPTPLRAGEVSVRRGLLENGLHLLAMKGLVARHLDDSGITYSANSEVTTFLDALSSGYAHSVRNRAEWAVQRLSGLTEIQVRELFEESIGRWRTEFVVEAEQADSL